MASLEDRVMQWARRTGPSSDLAGLSKAAVAKLTRTPQWRQVLELMIREFDGEAEARRIRNLTEAARTKGVTSSEQLAARRERRRLRKARRNVQARIDELASASKSQAVGATCTWLVRRRTAWQGAACCRCTRRTA